MLFKEIELIRICVDFFYDDATQSAAPAIKILKREAPNGAKSFNTAREEE